VQSAARARSAAPAGVDAMQGFDSCEALHEIDFPDSMASINGFYQCAGLSRIGFWNRVRAIIGFCGLHRMCRLELPRSIEVLGACGRSAFSDCEPFQTVVLSKCSHLRLVLRFDHYASLDEIEVPVAVEAIPFPTFKHCTSRMRATFEMKGQLTELNGFQYCEAIREFRIPASEFGHV
jgi:hypothetical protein